MLTALQRGLWCCRRKALVVILELLCFLSLLFVCRHLLLCVDPLNFGDSAVDEVNVFELEITL